MYDPLRWKIEIGVSYSGVVPRSQLTEYQKEHYAEKIEGRLALALQELQEELRGCATVDVTITKQTGI